MSRDFSKPQTVAVVTDSVAQVPDADAERLGVSVVPFSVHIENEKFLDGVDLPPQFLYQRMREEKIVPTTSAPSPADYLDVFWSLLNQGIQAIIHFCLSSKLSSAYNNACKAAKWACEEFPGRSVEVIDTFLAAIPQGFIVMAAAERALEGDSLSEILHFVKKSIPQCGLAATPGTLEYLARGGRIGKAAFLLGSMVKIKPILTLEEGVVSPIKVVRTEKRALEAIIDYVAKKIQGHKSFQIAILKADDAERALVLRDLVLKKLNPVKIIQTEFTPVMGVHTGPGLVGLAYFYE